MGSKIRSKYEVQFALLNAFLKEEGGCNKTKAIYEVIMNYKRASDMITCFLDNDLLSSDVIDGSTIYSITDEGIDYIAKLCLEKLSDQKTGSGVLKEIEFTLLDDYFDC